MSKMNKQPKLQQGAELLPKIEEVQRGNWSLLKVDASIAIHGVVWLRVYGGFGGRFDREDWIADLPGVSISVCDYHWNGSDFGPSYPSFEDACRGQLESGLRHARTSKAEAESEVAVFSDTIARLEAALAGGPK